MIGNASATATANFVPRYSLVLRFISIKVGIMILKAIFNKRLSL